MTTKAVCFIKRTQEGYQNLFEILSWFTPDFSRDFGMKCVFGSMLGSIYPWIAWAPKVAEGTLPPFFWMVLVSIFVVPILAHPLYRAFGICFCGAKP